MLRVLILCLLPVVAFAQNAAAPDPTELAEIRDELAGLTAEIDTLRQLIIAESVGGVSSAGIGPSILRLDRLEAELRLVNGRVEQIANYIDQVVSDGTTRIGDLEFRLTELAGGDLAAIPDTPRLGEGTATPAPKPKATTTAAIAEPIDPNAPKVLPPRKRKPLPGAEPVEEEQQAVSPAPQPEPTAAAVPEVELAVSEKSDFDRAKDAYDGGDVAGAVILFGSFLADYPGGPLSVEALFHLGEAQTQLGQYREAARSYLDTFTADPGGNRAPMALMRVGTSLAQLGQVPQACQTLREVIDRYPGDPVLGEAQSQSLALNCE